MTQVEEQVAAGGRPPEIKAVPVRHPGRWIAVVAIAVLVAMAVHTVAFSRIQRGNGRQTRFGWGVVGDNFLSSPILHGVVVTIELTLLGMAIGIVGGVLLAVMRLSVNPVLSGVSWFYIWIFRGTPLLVQVVFWYQGISYLYPHLSFGVPFGPSYGNINANNLITPFLAGTLALGFNEAAYMAEIVRAGILSVNEGQSEAAQSLGMNRALTLRRIVLPQAMRVVIPPTGNELISMLKNSSLAFYASVTELFFEQGQIAARTYQTVPLLITASLWYLIITSVLTIGQYYVERYYARGSARRLPPTQFQRFRTLLTTFHAPPPAAATGEGPSLGIGHGGGGAR
ncbi:MAG TPA: amino acid ABC transporter permease [Jatrophihabitans sp.]|nr:amino acid ABC transporter permease [Jatrophihabitans sp.]